MAEAPDNAIPRTVYEAAFQPNRLETLRSRNSAAYKGLNILILRDGALDFFWNEGIQKLASNGTSLDIHHIFPRKWCTVNGIDPDLCNSIQNKTPISYKANRMIGGNAPSQYLQKIQKHVQVGINDQRMNDILETHLIDPATLRADDFNNFINVRRNELLKLVAKVMN